MIKIRILAQNIAGNYLPIMTEYERAIPPRLIVLNAPVLQQVNRTGFNTSLVSCSSFMATDFNIFHEVE